MQARQCPVGGFDWHDLASHFVGGSPYPPFAFLAWFVVSNCLRFLLLKLVFLFWFGCLLVYIFPVILFLLSRRGSAKWNQPSANPYHLMLSTMISVNQNWLYIFPSLFAKINLITSWFLQSQSWNFIVFYSAFLFC